MDEEKAPQGDSQENPRARNEAAPARPKESGPTEVAGWAGAPTSQVVRTVAAALLTTVVMLGALFLLWQVRTFVGWFVISLFLAAVLNPAVNWLQRRHRLIKRPLAIALTYLGLVVVLLFVAGIFVPLVGATLGGALLVIVGLFVEPWRAAVLLVFVLVYQQVESNLLQPLVYSQAVQLNGLIILIALLVGGQLMGIPGALLAIPVAEIIRIVITELRNYRRAEQGASETSVASSPPPDISE
jgi:predicted PurR-regulated permease PerM